MSKWPVTCVPHGPSHPHRINNGWGRIINIGGAAHGNYIASVRNTAVSSLTKNLADELGPKGINVIVIHPGTTRAGRMIDPAAETKLSASVSIGRLVDVTEIAFLVAFLAPPKSITINVKPSLRAAVRLDPSIIEGTSSQRLVSTCVNLSAE